MPLLPGTIKVEDYQNPAIFGAFVRPYMMDVARWAACNQAKSYRDFFVGACGAYMLRGVGVVAFAYGANNSPYPGAPKDCAEMDLVRDADSLAGCFGEVQSLDIFVAAPHDPDLILDVTGLATPTLHMCSECRGLLSEHPAFGDETAITTFGIPEHAPIEHTTFRGLLDLYKDVEIPPSTRELQAYAGQGLPRV